MFSLSDMLRDLVPGASEGGMDTEGLDPYEGVMGRREREVRALLDKVCGSTRSDPEFVGGLAPPSKLTTKIPTTGGSGSSRANEIPYSRLSRNGYRCDMAEADSKGKIGREKGEKGEKRKMQGKGKSVKKYRGKMLLILQRSLFAPNLKNKKLNAKRRFEESNMEMNRRRRTVVLFDNSMSNVQPKGDQILLFTWDDGTKSSTNAIGHL
ncbi:hypothetical protein BDP27DRAFT_1432197 [Rhodocollybia butyracea]|uniref:BING4 C-terminal domain-containing protein n=1 Tax=Rhodocollybia butyracea TaxID=206335 RepID=A0A9P5TY13_9AGAR|nr:hypothetical protein BDP27DRAFT_1432197 [Rhodocollybia butyracea]